MINVVAAVLLNSERQVLIARRKKGKVLEGYWEFPGGKVEEYEKPEQSLIRELKEEMFLDIRISKFIGESIYTYEKGTIKLLAYKASIINGEVKLVDHDAYKWVEIKDLYNYKLAPADIPIINMI